MNHNEHQRFLMLGLGHTDRSTNIWQPPVVAAVAYSLFGVTPTKASGWRFLVQHHPHHWYYPAASSNRHQPGHKHPNTAVAPQDVSSRWRCSHVDAVFSVNRQNPLALIRPSGENYRGTLRPEWMRLHDLFRLSKHQQLLFSQLMNLPAFMLLADDGGVFLLFQHWLVFYRQGNVRVTRCWNSLLVMCNFPACITHGRESLGSSRRSCSAE